MHINTTSAKQTHELGKLLGQEIVASNINEAIVIALEGDLGSGKTTFVKGLAKGLGITDNVVSPTFILVGAYNNKSKIKNTKILYHIDPYRLQDASSLVPELQEILKIPHAVIAIEWAKRLKAWLPEETIWIEIAHEKQGRRVSIRISAEKSMKHFIDRRRIKKREKVEDSLTR